MSFLAYSCHPILSWLLLSSAWICEANQIEGVIFIGYHAVLPSYQILQEQHDLESHPLEPFCYLASTAYQITGKTHHSTVGFGHPFRPDPFSHPPYMADTNKNLVKSPYLV